MPGRDVGRLQRDVGDAVDLDARRDLDEQAGLARARQEPLRHRRLGRTRTAAAGCRGTRSIGARPSRLLHRRPARSAAGFLDDRHAAAAPIRVAPASIIVTHVGVACGRRPTPSLRAGAAATRAAISATSCGRRAAGGEPGRGLDEVARRAFIASSQARTFSLVGQQRRLEDHLAHRAAVAARLDDRRGCRGATAASSPPLRAPMLITMSISRAPSRIARRASSALLSAGCAPSGKPTTQQTLTGEPRSSSPPA